MQTPESGSTLGPQQAARAFSPSVAGDSSFKRACLKTLLCTSDVVWHTTGPYTGGLCADMAKVLKQQLSHLLMCDFVLEKNNNAALLGAPGSHAHTHGV